MDCVLMHKNIPVVDLEIDETTGTISKIKKTRDFRHIPVGVKIQKDIIDRKTLNDWWTGRSIPASRDGIDGIKEVLGQLNIYNTGMLLDKCYGLSLSDQYWICPENSGLLWGEINFFNNSFSKDMGGILFGHKPADITRIDLVSPDNTSDGWLRKKWVIADGRRFLMKGGSGVYEQEPFNEIIACAVMRRLGINHINYTLTFDKNKPYCLCENFVTPDTELIPAWRVKESLKKDNRESELTHLLRCCDYHGIPGVTAAIDKMLVLDYIISNEDRHYNNFGFIRNAETLEWLGFAPVFDSGTSLWYNTQFVGRSSECKPFRKSHNEQIKLVTDLSWFNIGALKDIGDEIIEIFALSETVGADRRAAIAKSLTERCGRFG